MAERQLALVSVVAPMLNEEGTRCRPPRTRTGANLGRPGTRRTAPGPARTWLQLGRCVRRGEKALRILAPVSVKERDAAGEETGERRVFFETAFVFELSQTEAVAGVEPVALRAPCEPLTGDSHAHLLTPLGAFAQSLGYAVSFEVIEGSAGGWCDRWNKRIVVDADVPPNAQLRTLIHECAGDRL